MHPPSSTLKTARRLLALSVVLCLALLSTLTSQVELVEETVESVQTLTGLDSIGLPDAPDHDPFPLGLAHAPERLVGHPTPRLALPFDPAPIILATPPPRRA